MKKNYYAHLNRMYIKYNRIIKSLQKTINNGRFATYAKERQTQLLKILGNYESQLKKAGFVLGTSLALMMPPSTAYAQPAKLGSEIKVSTTTNGIEFPTVAVDNDGDFAVTWGQYDTASSYTYVYMQRYDNTGAAQGSEVKVTGNSALFFAAPDIAMDDDGDFVIVWEGYDITTNVYSVYMQRYDNNGAAQGGETIINTAAPTGGSLSPGVAMDDDGDFVVTWSSYNSTTGAQNIHFQRFDATGTKQGTETTVNVNSTETISPEIAMDDDGDFVIVWTGYEGANSSHGLYMQRYDNTGTAQGTETKVNTSTGGLSYIFPSVAMDSHGDFVVVWTEQNGFGPLSVHMQRYNPTGVPQGTQTQVNPTGTTGISFDRAVGMDETGNFVVTWNDDSNVNAYSLYGQAYQSTGTKIGSSFIVETGNVFMRGLAMEPDGDFVVAYSKYDVNTDAYAQRYTGGLPTDVAYQALDSELTIYPNPVENELFLEASVQGMVKVYNMLGQAIKEISLNNSTISIDVSDLPTGQYLLEIVSKEGQRSAKKFIKK